MKHILLSCLFAAGLFSANAQTVAAQLPADAVASGDPAPKAATATPVKNVVYVSPAEQWKYVDMQVTDNTAWFLNTKGMNSLHVYVTDGDGKVMIDQKLGQKANGIDLSRLRKGAFFVTLVNEQTDERKAFMLNH